MVLRIAFGGKMGSGKDTAASYLSQRYHGSIRSFAAPLYDILHYAQQVCGFKEEKDRKFLQFVGTEWARSHDPDIWIKIALNEPTPGNIFISDVRFENELKALKEDGWTCVKIHRAHQDQREGTGSSQHVSEKELDVISNDQWDYIIDNNGDLRQFYAELDKMISNINESNTNCVHNST